MKKPDPQYPIIKLSLQQWEEQRRLDEMTDEDKMLQEWNDRLNTIHKLQLAKNVYKIIKKLKLTKRQLQIFTSYVETGSYRQTARELKVTDHKYIMDVVISIQERVKEALNSPKTTPQLP